MSFLWANINKAQPVNLSSKTCHSLKWIVLSISRLKYLLFESKQMFLSLFPGPALTFLCFFTVDRAALCKESVTFFLEATSLARVNLERKPVIVFKQIVASTVKDIYCWEQFFKFLKSTWIITVLFGLFERAAVFKRGVTFFFKSRITGRSWKV